MEEAAEWNTGEFAETFRSVLHSFIKEGVSRKTEGILDRLAYIETAVFLDKIQLLLSELLLRDESAVAKNAAGVSSELKQLPTKKDRSKLDELIKILSQPNFTQLLKAHDDVASGKHKARLPPIPYEVDEDEGMAVKIVRLVKNQEPLGATIKWDEAGNLVVARIMRGGVADRSGCIQVGDIVVEVNENPTSGKQPSEIVQLLAQTQGTVTFKLLPAPGLSHLYDDRTLVPSGQHLRAFFTYNPNEDPLNPCPEASIHFRKGDILEVSDSSDDHWWQAAVWSPYGSGEQAAAGLIPSPRLEERRCLASSKASSLGSAKKLRKVMYELRESQCFDQAEAGSYEEVALLYPRPEMQRAVVLVGAGGVGRNELKRRLIMLNPDRFSSTVPHTSRPPRPGEVEGVDYCFAGRDQMEEWVRAGSFIEFGEYRGNLYGTLLESVKEVMRRGKTPVLNPHPQALKLLRRPDLQPLVVFIKPPPFPTLKETRSTGRALSPTSSTYSRGFSDEELQQMIQNSKYLEQVYAHYFDHTLSNGNLEFAFRELTDVVQRMDTEPQWVPASWVK